MRFEDLLKTVRAKFTNWQPPRLLLALDPGETTGWALFEEGSLLKCGQLDTKEEPQRAMMDFLAKVAPTEIICEDYRVYGHKTDQHAWASLHTPQLIGAIRLLAVQQNINMHLQMATMAKGFCSDAKLKQWGYWQKGQRHSRDAIRHGCYHLLLFRGDYNGNKAKAH